MTYTFLDSELQQWKIFLQSLNKLLGTKTCLSLYSGEILYSLFFTQNVLLPMCTLFFIQNVLYSNVYLILCSQCTLFQCVPYSLFTMYFIPMCTLFFVHNVLYSNVYLILYSLFLYSLACTSLLIPTFGNLYHILYEQIKIPRYNEQIAREIQNGHNYSHFLIIIYDYSLITTITYVVYLW